MASDQGEVTMVCIDNSGWMRDSPIFEAQLDAFRLYCRTKLESNPKNSVGTLTMSSYFLQLPSPPTSDLDKILASSRGILVGGGGMDFERGIGFSFIHLGSPENKHNKKRLLIFVGSPFTFGMATVTYHARLLRRKHVALDIVNFCVEEKYRTVLDAFVGLVNTNDNSHIKHVHPGCCMRDVLSRTPGALITRASIEDEDLAAAAVEQKRLKKLFAMASRNLAPSNRIPLKLFNRFEALSPYLFFPDKKPPQYFRL